MLGGKIATIAFNTWARVAKILLYTKFRLNILEEMIVAWKQLIKNILLLLKMLCMYVIFGIPGGGYLLCHVVSFLILTKYWLWHFKGKKKLPGDRSCLWEAGVGGYFCTRGDILFWGDPKRSPAVSVCFTVRTWEAWYRRQWHDDLLSGVI